MTVRHEPNLRLDKYRQVHPMLGGSPAGANWGYFVVPWMGMGGDIAVISSGVSPETGWEHVSVSIKGAPSRTPTWAVMCYVKALFWGDNETVIQFHPKASEYVNVHAGCLHLWRKMGANLPLPPKELIA